MRELLANVNAGFTLLLSPPSNFSSGLCQKENLTVSIHTSSLYSSEFTGNKLNTLLPDFAGNVTFRTEKM